MSPDSRRKIRITRDALIVLVALGLSVYEIVWGGARPSVLVFLGGLLAAPFAVRVDEARRANKKEQSDATDG
jgi:hypothetical protein